MTACDFFRGIIMDENSATKQRCAREYCLFSISRPFFSTHLSFIVPYISFSTPRALSPASVRYSVRQRSFDLPLHLSDTAYTFSLAMADLGSTARLIADRDKVPTASSAVLSSCFFVTVLGSIESGHFSASDDLYCRYSMTFGPDWTVSFHNMRVISFNGFPSVSMSSRSLPFRFYLIEPLSNEIDRYHFLSFSFLELIPSLTGIFGS